VAAEEVLGYAGEVLGWHEDWPEVRPSNWHLLPDLDALRKKWRKKLVLPREKKRVEYLDICGECFRSFVSSDREESAKALRVHVVRTPCGGYERPKESPFHV